MSKQSKKDSKFSGKTKLMYFKYDNYCRRSRQFINIPKFYIISDKPLIDNKQ